MIPSILLFAALVELGMMPMVTRKLQGQNKIIVGGSMVMGSFITALIGVAFWMGWIG